MSLSSDNFRSVQRLNILLMPNEAGLEELRVALTNEVREFDGPDPAPAAAPSGSSKSSRSSEADPFG